MYCYVISTYQARRYSIPRAILLLSPAWLNDRTNHFISNTFLGRLNVIIARNFAVTVPRIQRCCFSLAVIDQRTYPRCGWQHLATWSLVAIPCSLDLSVFSLMILVVLIKGPTSTPKRHAITFFLPLTVRDREIIVLFLYPFSSRQVCTTRRLNAFSVTFGCRREKKARIYWANKKRERKVWTEEEMQRLTVSPVVCWWRSDALARRPRLVQHR